MASDIAYNSIIVSLVWYIFLVSVQDTMFVNVIVHKTDHWVSLLLFHITINKLREKSTKTAVLRDLWSM